MTIILIIAAAAIYAAAAIWIAWPMRPSCLRSAVRC